MQETELSFEDVMPGIEEYFLKHDNYTKERCMIRKCTVLGIISSYREDRAGWVVTRDILSFIENKDNEFYSQYGGGDRTRSSRSLGLKIGQSLSISRELKFIERNDTETEYRFNSKYEGMIDEIKEYINDFECVEEA